ncbi:MAG: PspC domain-containing protein [Pyrinomonadaceae bacterium]|nr:PspC domain-containing protein [Sphingobacteriaceae bacterium]
MEKKLERSAHNKMIAGVSSGLADYLDMDVTVIRICFILLAVFGAGVLVYIIMWIAIPEKPFFEGAPIFEPKYTESGPDFSDIKTPQSGIIKEKKDRNGRMIAGAILVLIGTYFMLNEFNIIPHWFSVFKLWPVLLIGLGLMILFKSGKKKSTLAGPLPWQEPVSPDDTIENTTHS